MCRNVNRTLWQMILTMHKKFDRQNTAIRKSKVKTPTRFTKSSSSTISKVVSFQFWSPSFQNGYSPPISTKNKIECNSSNPFNNPFNDSFKNAFRFTRPPKSTDTYMGCGEQYHGEKTIQNINSKTKQADLEFKVSYNSFDTNIELIHSFQNLKNREFELTNQKK